MTHGYIFDIKKFSINDGPGVRTTVFFQGCPLACPWCHNPESRSPEPVLMYRANRCTLCGECVKVCQREAIKINGRVTTDRARCNNCGKCTEVCYQNTRELSGYKTDVDEVTAQVERDRPFYEQSGGGVTFSGGEPTMQPHFLKKLLRACRESGIPTAVDTSGFCSWDVLDDIREYVDLFLYDLKLMDEARHQAVLGAPNRQILDNLKQLSAEGHNILVRIPLIPGINDDEDNLRRSGEFLCALPSLAGVELMGYHEIGLAKYEALDIPYTMTAVRPPTPEHMQHCAAILEEYGLTVKVS